MAGACRLPCEITRIAVFTLKIDIARSGATCFLKQHKRVIDAVGRGRAGSGWVTASDDSKRCRVVVKRSGGGG